jgi:CheY-like chemotaxis protein
VAVHKVKKVLVVEDENELSGIYKKVLEKHGYKVMVATNGQEALDVVYDYDPRVILLDIKMPKMNGLEFLDNFEATEPSPSIVVFSNIEEQKEVKQALASGANRYLLKAWASPNDLVRVVDDAFSI